ncbi:MAG: hypothetical protein NT040_05455 [Bacteroidetes bacterium]|nr:hypothetical protein [Bacteroidota bacterium]
MRKFRIFDNGGKTVDRFTLINNWGEVFGFDENPFNPLGFGQFCGNISQWQSKATKHLGRKISFDALTKEAKEFVKDRI